MRLFESNKAVLNLFLEKVSFGNMVIKSREHSQVTMDGESDIVLTGNIENRILKIFIENKIDAPAMENQAERYVLRGNECIKNNECDDFAVILYCPEKYYSSNTKAKNYSKYVFYEQVLDILNKESGPQIDIQLIEAAINKSKSYEVVENEVVTNFWNSYYKHLQSCYGGRGLFFKDNRNHPKRR